jgi:hypothetical protein
VERGAAPDHAKDSSWLAQSRIDSLGDFRLSQKQLSVHFAASPRDAVPQVLGVRWDVAGILSAQH